MRNIQEWSILNEWDEARTMYAFRLSMRGEAVNWINSVARYDSMEELIGKFRERFVGKTLVLTIIKDMAKMQYDGTDTILGFLDKMVGMARRAKLPEDVLVALSLNAIPEEMGKLILLNSKGGLAWDAMYQACGNLRSCKAEIKVMTVKEEEGKGWNKQKKKGLTCLLCGKPGHVVRRCRYNSLNSGSLDEHRTGKVSECSIGRDEAVNDNKPV